MTADPAVTPGRRARLPLSITARLTAYYTAATTAVLLISIGFLYWRLSDALTLQDRRLVASKLRVVTRLVETEPELSPVVESEVAHEAGDDQPLRYYIRIVDERGRTLLATPGMPATLAAAGFPDPDPRAVKDDDCSSCGRSSDGRYLVVAAEARGPGALAPRLVVQVALDVAHNGALLASYRMTLFAVVAVGLVVAAAIGAVVARTGLRPLDAMSRRIPQVTASHLDERLATTAWPSELRGLADAFDVMLNRLQGSFTRLTEFSADLAHALRNPINSLRGEAEVALQRARTADEYQQVLGSELEELERLSRLIDGLLFIARADDPQAAVEHLELDARREMDAVREFYEALADERSVTVACEGNARITGDPMLVRRALSNLLANALNHTGAGGRVTLLARKLDGGGAELAVRDTGHGIAPEHLSRVFDRFYHVADARSRGASGAGLGLAIVQSIMRLHGGTATIASSVGEGTTVTLRFPA
jgi:two-component system heavy metal sensor histidine kinase CusS